MRRGKATRRRAIAAGIAGVCTVGLVIAMSSSSAAGAGSPGSLDRTFGNGGTVVSVAGGQPTDAVREANGNILVSMGLEGSYAVARYTPNGALDPSFGTGGIAKTSFSTVAGSPTVEGFADALALEPSGKIVLVGGARAADGASAFGVARLKSNGSIDTTFGSGGQTEVTGPAESLISADAVLVQPNNQILVGGYRLQGGRPTKLFGLLMRFNSNGTLDPGFANMGQATLPSTSGDVTALGLDSAGDVFALTSLTAAQSELTPSGALDASATPATITSRSVGGFGAFDVARSFLENDQSLVAHDVTTSRRGFKAQVERFSPAGSLDPTFANPLFRYTGETTILGRDNAAAEAVAPDGKVVAVGSHQPEGTPAGSSVLGVERLQANGELDGTFGNGGGVTTAFPEHSSASAVLVEPDGNIVVIGVATKGQAQNVVLARYLG